jgi:hypothetical protein
MLAALPWAAAGMLVNAGAPVSILAQQPVPAPSAGEWMSAERALGRTGQLQPDGAMKFSFPRGDLSVSVGGVRLKPALALGSWVAFHRTAAGRAHGHGRPRAD